MQAPSTKDLTNSPRLVIIKFMSVIAEYITITAVIIGSKNCAAIMRIRFALSIGSKNCAAIMRIRLTIFNLKREEKCSLHRKRFLKNIVSFTPIHKDEQITKINSKEIILMFR